ncbi:hypothetical protein [Vibrio harveyi]|uniref:hypothetical protein n=1 Tax=Vibrio harveyi TaxID=669 RepID=UPI00390BDAB8
MKEAIKELFKALTNILTTVTKTATIASNLADSGVHVSEVVVDAAEHFKLTERLANATEIEELRKKFASQQQQSTEQE